MTTAAPPIRSARTTVITAVAATAITGIVLFAQPLANTVSLWWSSPEAGHGLLLAPLSIYLAWRRGIRPDAKSNPGLGLSLIAVAVFLRYASALAADVFMARGSMFLALAGIVIWAWGVRQILWWWLPAALLALSVPLPEIVLSALALPLQLKASRMGAALLASRGVPVRLAGNVIHLPGHDLFVTEACSGLRSLTALLSLGVLTGGLALKRPISRIALLLISIPVAVVINGVRVFLTGFFVAFGYQSIAEGFDHLTEGWLLFVVAFVILGVVAVCIRAIERRFMRASANA